MFDFVPNHTAPDHRWVRERPEYYVHGGEDDLAREPGNYFRTPEGRVLALGRDPYFPGWPDTAQLDWGDRPPEDAAEEMRQYLPAKQRQSTMN